MPPVGLSFGGHKTELGRKFLEGCGRGLTITSQLKAILIGGVFMISRDSVGCRLAADVSCHGAFCDKYDQTFMRSTHG